MLTGTVDPGKVFAGFANSSVLLVVVAFLVAVAVVKCGLGRRISLHVVRIFGKSTLGLGYSIFVTDAMIAPGFPSNTSRGGVLFPIVLALAQSSGSAPEDEVKRRLGGYLMFCGMASLSISSVLWLTATSANPIGVSLAAKHGLEIGFGRWLLVASVPALLVIGTLPLLIYKLFPPGVISTPEAPEAARQALIELGPLSRDDKVTALAFSLMAVAWILAGSLGLNSTAVAIAGLGSLLATKVLTVDDGSGGQVAVYSEYAHMFAIIRKILLRMKSWQNLVFIRGH